MSAWSRCMQQIHDTVDKCAKDCKSLLFFRGHANPEWRLLPSLIRRDMVSWEKDLYYSFVSRAGPLLSSPRDVWQVLYAMRHHGLPSRLLDWSESFAVALYFALEECKEGDCVVWILDALGLNEKHLGERGVYTPLPRLKDYDDLFHRAEDGSPKRGAIAQMPVRMTPRVTAQRGVFTVHLTDARPLEEQCPDLVTSVVIPESAQREAWRFLMLAGVDWFSLFPDLDGLAHHMMEEQDWTVPTW